MVCPLPETYICSMGSVILNFIQLDELGIPETQK